MGRMVEIDEDLLVRGQQSEALLKSFRANPKAWRKILEAQREVKPDDPMVKELDKPDENEKWRTEQEEKYANLKKAFEEEVTKREQDEKIKQWQAKREQGFAELKRSGWTDEGIKGVEKIMEDKALADPLDAAAIFEKNHPPQEPIMPTHSGNWNFLEAPPEGADDSDFYKQLLETQGKSESLIDNQSRKALRDIRGLATRR